MYIISADATALSTELISKRLFNLLFMVLLWHITVELSRRFLRSADFALDFNHHTS